MDLDCLLLMLVIITSTTPLALNNVLVTPSIIKNLVSIRKFTKDNSVSIEFDPYGFSVKDLQTRTLRLRCNSTGELYPITMTPTQFLALTTTTPSTTIWHRRLGHPGNNVMSSLFGHSKVCNESICHAWELGKHTRLPFSPSLNKTYHVFELLHSD